MRRGSRGCTAWVPLCSIAARGSLFVTAVTVVYLPDRLKSGGGLLLPARCRTYRFCPIGTRVGHALAFRCHGPCCCCWWFCSRTLPNWGLAARAEWRWCRCAVKVRSQPLFAKTPCCSPPPAVFLAPKQRLRTDAS